MNNLPINQSPPRIMHIDLNSCFAIIEQQSNRLLRGKPVAVAAYNSPKGMIIASSYEAKRLGIKLGVNVGEAKEIYPKIAVLTPDPEKYREAHRRFKEVLLNYTSDVVPKSIDEFVVDFGGSPVLRMQETRVTSQESREAASAVVKSPESRAMSGSKLKAPSSRLFTPNVAPPNLPSTNPHLLIRTRMCETGYQIKQDIHDSLGEAVTVNVGIGPNRFLAKLAAGLHKPDGLDYIDHTNLRTVLSSIDLLDLPGINVRYKHRLQTWGINTPLEFLDAEDRFLTKVVFESIVGHYWYLRLRGHEVDAAPIKTKTIGHQYALSKQTADREELNRLMFKLAEKVGRRLRRNNYFAHGIHLSLSMLNRGYWHHGNKLDVRLHSTADIVVAAQRLLAQAIITDKVRGISITVFDLHPANPEQLSLLDDNRKFSQNKRISEAMDAANNRYGEFVVTPATMMDMQGTILDRIAFGSVRE